MAHPWHLVMMRRHHEIEPLMKESSALRAFLRYCHGSAPSAKHLGLQGGSAHLSFAAGIVYAAPHQQPSLDLWAKEAPAGRAVPGSGCSPPRGI